ncbi:MAG: hypothetical protein M3O15_01790 [Acidobacteriota bacterium]|nr:hypothetical protein [Acidobacteriota bacterium]
MKIVRVLFGLMALVALGAAAGRCSGNHEAAGGTWVRVANRSAVDFEGVTVTFPDGAREYGRLPQGASASYQKVEKAYRYAAVEVVAKEGRLALQPHDFMGEKPLGPGRYTYALTVDGAAHRLALELIQDQ